MIEKNKRKASALGAFFVALVVIALLVPDATLDRLGTWVLVVMLLPANYFPIFYTVAFRWWGGHLGRALFIKALGLAIVLDTALMVKYLGGEAYADEIRFVAYTLVLTGMFYQSFEMTRIRIMAQSKDTGERTSMSSRTDLRGVDLRHEQHNPHDAEPDWV